MAFRASSIIPAEAYKQVKQLAVNVKRYSQGAITSSAAGPITYDDIRDLYVFLKNAEAQLVSLAAIPGLSEYAAAQEDGDDYNIGAEFTEMLNAIAAARSWMTANVPTTGITAVAPESWTASGSMIATTFASEQTAALRTNLQTIVNAIV